MKKIKIEIKSIFGKLLFEYESENNTIKETLCEAVKRGANLIGANLRDANLEGANLRGANLRGANLEDANLRGANLIGANLEDANLIGANLRDANLEGANLIDANLIGANLIGANLIGANLRGANLRDANLRGANLIVANLEDANLRGAKLRGVNLIGANLRGANLRGANLEDANLRGANLIAVKADMFMLLLEAITEIPKLKKSIIEGKIDGSTYEGECACLCGTLEKSEDADLRVRIHDLRDHNRPIEKLFLNIKKGDTPQTNQVSKLVLDWVEEFEVKINRFFNKN
jgi:uncharacterized protein YjbI with pentapeptide repeats